MYLKKNYFEILFDDCRKQIHVQFKCKKEKVLVWHDAKFNSRVMNHEMTVNGYLIIVKFKRFHMIWNVL